MVEEIIHGIIIFITCFLEIFPSIFESIFDVIIDFLPIYSILKISVGSMIIYYLFNITGIGATIIIFLVGNFFPKLKYILSKRPF